MNNSAISLTNNSAISLMNNSAISEDNIFRKKDFRKKILENNLEKSMLQCNMLRCNNLQQAEKINKNKCCNKKYCVYHDVHAIKHTTLKGK